MDKAEEYARRLNKACRAYTPQKRINLLLDGIAELATPKDTSKLPECLLQPRVLAQAEYILYLASGSADTLEECLIVWKSLREGLRHRPDLLPHPMIRRVQQVLQEAVEAVRNQGAESVVG